MKRFLLTLLRSICSDELYCRIRYFLKFKRPISFQHPQTFNEKINWLKLFYHQDYYHDLVDKYKVRFFVEKKIGTQYLVPLIGYYTNADQIDFDKLPQQFVLKGTHGSGWVLVCKDKMAFDIEHAKKIMNTWLKKNFYNMFGEWVYKNLKPGIICEHYLSVPEESSLPDYKIYCFDGEPKFCHVDLNRFSGHQQAFFDLNWNRLSFSRDFPVSSKNIEKPICWEKMLDISRQLSHNIPFVRIDLYVVDGKIYFGEMTFVPGNGYGRFHPDKIDYELGKLIHLPIE